LFSLVALLPWWAGIALAALSYAVLHRIASPGASIPPIAATPGGVGTAAAAMVWPALARVGQYVLPLICLFAAAASALARAKRRRLVHDVAAGAENALDGMSWREFEMLVGEAFRLQGYHVVETGGGGADGGVDLVLRKDRQTHLVQCKQWKAGKVGVNVVREIHGVMAHRGAAGGFVLTSGRFSREATAFANQCNIRLVEGAGLRALIGQAKAARVDASRQAAPAAPAPATAPSNTR
jgi:restriction system protein